MKKFEQFARSIVGDTIYEIGEFIYDVGQTKKKLSTPLDSRLDPLGHRTDSPYTTKMKGGGNYYGGSGAPSNAFLDLSGDRGASEVIADANTLFSIALRDALKKQKSVKSTLDS